MNIQVLAGRIVERPEYFVENKNAQIIIFKIEVESWSDSGVQKDIFSCELTGLRAEKMIKSVRVGNFVYVRGKSKSKIFTKGNNHKDIFIYTEVDDVQWFPLQNIKSGSNTIKEATKNEI